MKNALGILGIALVFAGCATASQAPRGTAFTGEVWTWDEQAGTVTLLQEGGRTVRVKVSPDQLAGLRLHQYTTLRGEVAPGSIETIQIPARPMTAKPKGNPDQLEITGTVRSVDATGKIAVDSERGPVELWVPAGVNQRFAPGTPARVRVTVQPVEMVPIDTAPAAPEPPAPAQREPGDYAVVIGRVLQVDPRGAMRVDAPNGSIVVLVPDPARYRVGDNVEVRTSVHPAR